MGCVNKVILVGRVGKDPEVRYTSGGDSVAMFSLATSESWKDAGGEKKEKTEWHNIVAWKKLAELAKNYLPKGSLVYIEGKLQTRKWTDNDNNTRYTTEIVAQTFTFLESNKNKPAGNPDYSSLDGPMGIDDSDIPF